MKLNNSRQLVLVTAASLLAAGLLTACSTLTVDFVFVTSAKAAGANNYGEIDIFEVNSESGHMRQIPASPVPSGGRNPVAEAVSADNKNLFVVNQDDNTIVQFVIGNDGKLYPFSTVNTPGVFPLAVAVSSSNLFVADTYQPLPSCSPAAPCAGSIAVFPLVAATGTNPISLGTPATNPSLSASYWPLTLSGASSADVIVPTGVNVVKSGGFVFVSAYDSSVTPHTGYVFAFAVGSGGVLSAVPGSPFAAGTQPSAIATDSTGAYVYITDFLQGNVRGYSVAASGALTALAGSPFPAGSAPAAIVVDKTYPYAYVANSNDSTITAYSIGSGVLTRLGSSTTGAQSYATGLDPVAIGIDPSTNHFLFTANFLGNNVSGFQLSSTAGTLLDAQGTPFPANSEPTAVAAIPHGSLSN